MVLHVCQICNFSSHLLTNYNRHLKTKKHQKNVEKCGKIVEENSKKNREKNQKSILFSTIDPQKKCHFCHKIFSRNDSLKRHISVCKISKMTQNIVKDPKGSKIVEKKNNFVCFYCHNDYQTKRGLNKHIKHCLAREKNLERRLLEKEYEKRLLQKDLEKTRLLNEQELAHKESIIREKEKTIEIAKNSKQIINNHTTHNKTINYLNSHYGDMISMEKFLYNLENTEQLTHHERDLLLMAFKENGIELFARSFSQIMKENCKRQLIKEGLAEMHILPLYCSDSNLRSHKEKEAQGWKTHYDNTSINKMISISSEQVYESHRQPLVIIGRHRDKVFKQVKKDNHSQSEKVPLLIDKDEND